MKKIMNIVIIAVFVSGLFAFTSDQTEWVVPEEYKTMVNPTDAADEDNLEIGEELYMKHCKSCHGKEGLGDGPKAEEQKGE